MVLCVMSSGVVCNGVGHRDATCLLSDGSSCPHTFYLNRLLSLYLQFDSNTTNAALDEWLKKSAVSVNCRCTAIVIEGDQERAHA